MKSTKNLIILAGVALVFIVAALFSEPTNQTISGSGDKVFPELMQKVNDVTYIKIQNQGKAITLTRNEDFWTVKENDGYPASLGKIRELLLGVANLERVEPKTKKPENYARIGLQDPGDGSKSTQITLIAGQEKKLADVIIGDSKPAKGDESQSSYYIRALDDPQSWLANGKLPNQWDPKNWLDSDIIVMKRDRIQQVKVTHEDGEVVYIHRDKPDTRDFILESLKEGEQVTAPYEVNNVATTFTTMRFDDVKSKTSAELPDKPVYTAELTTFDGMTVTFEPYKKDDKHWSTYKAGYNAELAKEFAAKLSEKPEQPAAEPENASAEPHSKAKPKASFTPMSEEEVKKEVELLNKRWSNWAYLLPEFRIQNIGKKKQDLLKKEDAAPVH